MVSSKTVWKAFAGSAALTLALTACGGGSDDSSSGATTGPTNASAGTVEESSETTAAQPADTAVATTAAPTTTVPSPFDDPKGAVTLVDGVAYDVCAVVPTDAITHLGTYGEPQGRSLDEISNS